jgi:hypothetical protein
MEFRSIIKYASGTHRQVFSGGLLVAVVESSGSVTRELID